MLSKTKEKDQISYKIKAFVNAIIESENDGSRTDKQKATTVTSRLRVFKRDLGVESSSKDYDKYAPRTILKYISTARKLLRESNLVAKDYKKQVQKLAKAYPKFSGVLLELVESDNVKKDCQDIINNHSTPKDLKAVLNKLKLEHPAYYRLLNTRIGSALEEVKTVKKESDNNAIVGKNKQESKKALRISREAVITAVEEGLNNKPKGKKENASRMALALILCTGRRNIEILKTGKMDVINENTILFSGQAKKKFGEVAKPYEIPVVFASAERVVQCLKTFRTTRFCKDLKGLDNESIAKRISSTLSDSARTRLLNNDANFYSSRSIYGNEAYKVYVEQNKASGKYETQAAYLAKLLGHDEGDLNTSLSYGGVNVDEGYSEKEAEANYKEQLKEALDKKPKAEGVHPLMEKLLMLEGKINSTVENKRSANTQAAIAQWLIAACKEDAEFAVTATNIRKTKGGRMESIHAVIEILKSL